MVTAVRDLEEFELSELEAAVGSRSLERGRRYARGNRVLGLEWDAEEGMLSGSVLGQGRLYSTSAYFAPDRHGARVFQDGECTCPVGHNCKHVAALVIAAGRSQGLVPAGRGPAADRTQAPVAARPAPATGPVEKVERAEQVEPAERVEQAPWAQPLLALIERPPAATGSPLAIELALKRSGHGRAAPGLTARLMRPGARGGWVNGSLAWTRLEPWQLRGSNHRPDHLALARELHALHSARQFRSSYCVGYGAEKTLELSDCDSPQLWSVLARADRLGLALIHPHPRLGEVAVHHRGRIVLDVTRDGDGGSLLAPSIRVEPEHASELEPVLFVGPSGHGVVCVSSAEAAGRDLDGCRLHLVRLAQPTKPELQKIVLARQRLRIPPGELERFASQLWPGLRHAVEVVSSDGTFTPPAISPPQLVLRAEYGTGHQAVVRWEWAYRIDERTERMPLALSGADPGFRDPAAERALLGSLELQDSGLRELGLIDDCGRPAAAPVVLGGLDTMRLASQVLPALEELPGVEIEVGGQPADYRDVGDSLAIAVSTAEVVGERDWFDLGVTISVEGHELPFAEVFVALAGGASHLLLPDGAHFSLLDPRLQELRRLIEEARSLGDSPAAPLRISRYQAGLWSELVALGVVSEQAEAWRRQVGALLELDDLAEHEPPAELAARLRDYQRDGFAWLATLWQLELGGVLADDMGLGKTLQALALICHARASRPGLGPFLVVAPTSVVGNWVAEATRFAPQLQVAPVTDTLAKAGRTIGELTDADIVVTTYTLLRLDSDAYQSVEWAGVVFDEAQYVKNHQAKTYRCARQLPAPFKLAITGTPMENNLMELWSILSITAPGLFPDPRRFAEQYARPIERQGDRERLARLRRRIKPLVKRRSKELVASELPDKQEQTLEIELHPRHRRLYDTRLQRERQRVLGLIDDFERNRFTILRSLTLLRQLSLHPGLVDRSQDAVPCAKLEALVEQLGEIAGGGHRALVFSQFTGFLSRVRERLEREGIGYCYLDGRTTRRQLVLERFKRGEDPVFLISLKAGGFGINLTEADYCFLLDPWWNPAAENQAVDRAHRIGQTRPVMVYRLIARHTIEEKVVALAQRKRALFSGVMDEGELFASGLTAEDIRGLLG